MYFSGCRRWSKLGLGEADLTRETGWQFRCFSYYYLDGSKTGADDQAAFEFWAQQKKGRMILDSGAHTFLETLKGQPMTAKMLDAYLDRYVKWWRGQQLPWDFVVNFDYIKNAPEIYRVLHALRERGMKPLPVYHGDSSLDWIKRYADEGHQLIGLGKPTYFRSGGKSLRQRYYAQVFSLTEKLGMRCHGFAVSGSNLFFLPWYSVDSATWVRAAIRGAILDYDPERRILKIHHVSKETLANPGQGERIHDLNPKVLAALRERIETRSGIKFKNLQQSSFWRCVHNIRTQLWAVGQPCNNQSGLHSWKPVL